MSGLPDTGLRLANKSTCSGVRSLAGRFSELAVTPLVKPARQTLWAGSSYWGTRNRHPPRGSTSLVASEQRDEQRISNINAGYPAPCLGFSIKVGPTKMIPWQPEGVTADFWYPSMRRSPPLAGAQRAPTTPCEPVFFRHVTRQARGLETRSQHRLTASSVRNKACS